MAIKFLSQAEIDALPDGTEVCIMWKHDPTEWCLAVIKIRPDIPDKRVAALHPSHAMAVCYKDAYLHLPPLDGFNDQPGYHRLALANAR